jgi:tyrosinase
MISLDRRTVLKGLAALPVAAGFSSRAWSADMPIRYDAASAGGIEMLTVYADAVRRMQALGENDPMGWLWQWYTHFVNATTTKTDEITRIFGTKSSSRRNLATSTWNTCQSHSGQNANYFLPWHRMFVYYFERIVRQVSGRPDFAMPYWDYTSSDPAKRGVLPTAFLLKDDPVFGSLYRAERSTLANSGQSIQANQPVDVMDISTAMAKTSYITTGGVQGFCRAIDSGIHGRIHTLVGTSVGMGAVPYAGRDPLFWVHHSNIDRMWASWNANGNSNPTTATWVSKTFVFADVNGVRVTPPISSVFDIQGLGYTYDAWLPGPTATMSATSALTTASRSSQGQPVRIAEVRGGAHLRDGAVHLKLVPVTSRSRTDVLGLDSARPEQHAYIVLRELHTWKQPEVLYHLYLQPGRASTTPGKGDYVGNINFFDAQFHDHGNARMDEALGENLYSFDVTALLRDIARRGQGAQESLRLTIVPAGRPTPGADPLVGSIELIRQ